MLREEADYPVQPTMTYLLRVLKCFMLFYCTSPLIYGIIVHSLLLMDVDYDKVRGQHRLIRQNLSVYRSIQYHIQASTGRVVRAFFALNSASRANGTCLLYYYCLSSMRTFYIKRITCTSFVIRLLSFLTVGDEAQQGVSQKGVAEGYTKATINSTCTGTIFLS